jgi:hypothetical protein
MSLHAQTTNTPVATAEAALPAQKDSWGARVWTDAHEEWGFDHRGTLQFSTLGVLLYDRVSKLLPDRWMPADAIHATEVRLDLKAAPASWLDLGLDPRLRLTASQFDNGHFEGDSDGYLGGWLVQARPTDDTRLAWSRQNLQWGPSYLTSPSNPFGGDNGKNMPSVELPSMTYLKASWLPSDLWSISFLANVVGARTAQAPSLPSPNLPPILETFSALRSAGNGFEPVYALKNDFTFDRRTFSLIISQRETDDPRVGAFGSWNISDAVILYAEGASDGHSDHDLLAGATYTFVDGSFLALEYYFNDGTDTGGRDGLSGLFTSSAMGSGGFTSRNYLLIQYATTELIDRTTLAARWIVNLDKRCHRLAFQADYDLGDQASLFANVVVDLGDESDEYGASLLGLATLGINLLF